MIVKEFIIQEEEGFHIRPAQIFVDKAMQFESSIRINNGNGIEVDGKSILGLMAMGLGKGEKMIIEVDGQDEVDAMEQLAALMDGV